MKSAFRNGRDIVLKDIEVPLLKPGQIRIRVEACGICGTDIHLAAADGLVTGHEVAGTVVEVGAGVEHVCVGDRVALDSATPCGRCPACRNARADLCGQPVSFWGSFGFAEEMVAPAASALPLPTGLDPVIACLQEPLTVALDMVRLAALEPGQNVLVMGNGPIGLMTLPLLRRAGAGRIFCTGRRRRQARFDAALALGSEAVLDPDETRLADFAFGCAIHRVLVTTPPHTLGDACTVAAVGGIVVFIGIGTGEGSCCTFDANAFHFKKLQLRASYLSPSLYGAMALELLNDGTVDGRALVSHVFSLAEIDQAFRVAAHAPEAIKVVVRPEP